MTSCVQNCYIGKMDKSLKNQLVSKEMNDKIVWGLEALNNYN